VSTGVYIDGFNLYYGALRGTPYRWLDLEAFCRVLLPREDVSRIRYFTARVSGVGDPRAPARQDIYLRALRTRPLVQVHFGTFLTNEVWMVLATPPTTGPRSVRVLKTEEKGSDVNLGCHLLLDAVRGAVDTAVVVSNDSDLAEPIRLARYEAKIRVGVVNPHPPHKRSKHLSRGANFFKQLKAEDLARSQFPGTLTDSTGSFTKPRGW
jgi:uncharacterized LabA/DUF88 family protein